MLHSNWTKAGILLIILAGAGMVYLIVAPLVRPLPVYMALPPVVLTDQDGQTFALDQTRGKVVVLNPVYTHCPDICPITTAKMKQIQDQLQAAGLSDQVQLVTFSVDPTRDTADVLKKFASAYDANPDNWVFLTGSSSQIQTLIKALGLYVERVFYKNNTPFPESSSQIPEDYSYYLVNHTDRFFLVDRQGNVRSFQPGSRTDVNEAIRIIRQLVKIQNGGS
jgi:protein SCO1/2